MVVVRRQLEKETISGEGAAGASHDQVLKDFQSGHSFSQKEPDADPPATDPPATDPPATDPPATDPPATDPPATDPPATDPPATDPPATDPPATDPSATDPPATDPPATDPPATDPPATEDFFTIIEDDPSKKGKGLDENGQQISQSQDGVTDEVYFSDLSEKTGLEIKSDDAIVSTITTLKHAMPNDASDLVQKIYQFEKSGGNVRQYLSVIGQQPDTLSDKESLRQKFFSENGELAQGNRELANEQFERQFDREFSILNMKKEETDFDTKAEYEQHVKDKEFAESSLKWKGTTAKAAFKKQQDEVLSKIPDSTQVDPEKAQKISDNYRNDVQDFKTRFKSIQVPVDEEGKTFYNLGLNQQTQPIFDQWAGDPKKFMDFIGFGDPDSVDSAKFLEHIAFTAMWEGKGKFAPAYQMGGAMVERLNKQTIEGRATQPGNLNRGAGGQGAAPAKGSPEEFAQDLAEIGQNIGGTGGRRALLD